MFQFKQFAVDQSGCAMKINTDGVLLGALAGSTPRNLPMGSNYYRPKYILDIGTGTGVIALMLAQRFAGALIDAIEIDKDAAETADRNFAASKYHERLSCYSTGFEDFFQQHDEKRYDFIVSNPPFYINSLKSPGKQRSAAKHADGGFFNTLINSAATHLTDQGFFWLILPIDTLAVVSEIALKAGLYINQCIEIRSYPNSVPHRQIIAFSVTEAYLAPNNFVIYQSPQNYTEQYKTTLKNFFTIF